MVITGCFFRYLSVLTAVVKPDPVQKLNTTYINATSCHVTWQFPAGLDTWFPLIFVVEYSHEWSSNVTVSYRNYNRIVFNEGII